MKLLFDQNLSFRLPALIADILPGAAHVRDFGMANADDKVVWELARDQQFTITSKDDDFRERVWLLGHPPRVIQLKLGNCSTGDVERALRRAHPQIVRLHQDSAASLLLITPDAALILVKGHPSSA